MTPRQLKRARLHLGWTQYHLARELGVTRNTLERWERGVHPIPHWVPWVMQYLVIHRPISTPLPPSEGKEISR